MRPSAKFQPSVFVSLVIVLVLGFGLLLAAGFTVVSAQSSSGEWISFGGEGEKTAPDLPRARRTGRPEQVHRHPRLQETAHLV